MKALLRTLESLAVTAGILTALGTAGLIEVGGNVVPVLIAGAITIVAGFGAYVMDWLVWIGE